MRSADASRKISDSLFRLMGAGRRRVARARLCYERHALSTWGPRSERNAGRILCYHSIGQRPRDVNDVSQERFRRHLEIALRSGFRFVPARELAAGNGSARDVAITFDDGLLSVATVAAPVLSEFGIPWTLFVVAGWSEHTEPWQRDQFLGWRQLEKLAAAGADIGSHSMTHPDFSTLADEPSIVTDELGESRRVIEARLGIRPDSFAIPYGQSRNWPAVASGIAKELGYETVFAQAEETRPPGTVARTFVTSFDQDRVFRALLSGAFDRWEEWF